jgi:hypothetical protein
MKANESKSIHVTFTTRRETCPPVHTVCSSPKKKISNISTYTLTGDLPVINTFSKNRNNHESPSPKMYWLLGHKSKLSTSNKLLKYKTILKPIWTYGIQLCGTASNSNIEILERFQSKALRKIVDAPWYVQNTVI